MSELIFVTLYNEIYLTRGILLFESLMRVCQNPFKMYILALDDTVHNYWDKREEKNIGIISLEDMIKIYPQVERLQKERSQTEFCWTLSAFSIQYVLKQYRHSMCIYIDADMEFFSDPMVLVEEMGEKSVLITEHRYHYKHYMANSSGKFCVQFMVFKNTVDGNNVLEWWRAKCEDECTLDPERGLCGDQKYLDDWESRFGNAVFNTPHFGSGIAQWNLQNYELVEDNDKWYVRDTISKVIMPLIFFHYQGLKELTSGIWKFDFDDVGKDYIEKIVVPYIINIYSEEKKINYKHSYNNLYKKLIRYRFDPIPYMGEKKLLITNHDKEKKKIDIRMAFENQEVYIIYDVHNDHGGWISINEISDYVIFSYIHELIWDILCLTIYEDEKNEEQIIFSICERKTRGMYVRVEFTTSPDKELDIKYPGYYKNEIYRIQDDNGIYKDKSMASIIDMNERFHELK